MKPVFIHDTVSIDILDMALINLVSPDLSIFSPEAPLLL